jgi:hypothetical protein
MTDRRSNPPHQRSFVYRRWAIQWLRVALAVCTLLGACERLRAEEIDLRNAVVVCPKSFDKREMKSVHLLVGEVQKRTGIRWALAENETNHPQPAIVLGKGSSETGAEGFQIAVTGSQVRLNGHDQRGLLFGVGRLLRELHMEHGTVSLRNDFNVASAPRYPIRGHQLGYRPKTNSYDGWDLRQWEQYFRDLAVFGTNAVELIPPRSDDAADSPHFPLPPMEMMVGMSRLADDYGLDVWVWYPALDADYSKPETVEFALKEWAEVFRKLSRIDAVFVPGGDPGHTRPKHLMALLAKQTESLHRFHPKAQMWMSPQGFSQEWMEEFEEILNREQPGWLSGVVYGPQVRGTPPELRARIPSKYPIRRYPDITHCFRCQYPVPDWDLAYALTEAREVINPRPFDQAAIFHAYESSAIGFISYSEGCNDDVNKIVWSSLGWDPNADIHEILREYSRYFIGEHYRDTFAQGLIALEKNWHGPLLTNESVFTTLKQFQAMEKSAAPRDLLNWRFQQGLYRAYYDAYERRRLVYETDLEEQAMEKLHAAREAGSLSAMNRAEQILDRAVTERVSQDWRARILELAEALFQSIRLQSSVEKYKAIEIGRGTHLDTIDIPLNNRIWLKDRFAELRAIEAEPERLKRIDSIVNWTNPGPGGFYDDLGNPSNQPHVIRELPYSKDPMFRASPLTGFTNRLDSRTSWLTHAEVIYDTPLRMRYAGLDGKAQYKLRAVYAGDNYKLGIRLVANNDTEIHPFIVKPFPLRPLEFDIPSTATRKGELNLSWYRQPGLGGNGRGNAVAEVWLMKR